MTRVIDTSEIIPVIADLCKKSCYELNDNLMCALREAYTKEESPYGKDTLDLLIKNAEYAKKEQIACCQSFQWCSSSPEKEAVRQYNEKHRKEKVAVICGLPDFDCSGSCLPVPYFMDVFNFI